MLGRMPERFDHDEVVKVAPYFRPMSAFLLSI
jgi:hypothetical protein